MSPMLSPQTTTISRPTSSAIALRPAGLISRDEPMANRSPAITNVSPRCTRARKSGIRYLKAPAFHRSSRVSRLSETQSVAGVIWSVSMASSFFLLPRTLRSQMMSARPRMMAVDAPSSTAEIAATADSRDTLGLSLAGWIVGIDISLILAWPPPDTRAGKVGIIDWNVRAEGSASSRVDVGSRDQQRASGSRVAVCARALAALRQPVVLLLHGSHHQ